MRLCTSSVLAALVLASGCVSQAQTSPDYADTSTETAGLSTGPGDDSYVEPTWSGPPGGAIDPGYGYEDPARSPSAQGADPAFDPSGTAYGGAMYGGQAYGDPWADPSATGGAPAEWAGATSDVTDGEIEMTLDAYGEWVEDVDYGRVWRPYTTVVGADFTPYESCGSWVFTDYGWTFQSCDEWAWGWLPFHFGRWIYLDSGWCWMRDYTWGPGWVEWRHGGGYVGWRPMRPTRVIRDHRDRNRGPIIRDHRRGQHEEWRFTRTDHFGRGPIRWSRGTSVNEGLRATVAVAQPPLRADFRSRASSVMAGRLRDHQRFDARARGGALGQSTRGYEPSRPYTTGGTRPYTTGGTRPYTTGGTRPYTTGGTRPYTNPRPYNPTYNPGVVAPNPNRPTWQTTRAPSTGTYSAPNGYRPPPAGAPNGSRPAPSWGGPRTTAPSPSTRPSTNWSNSRAPSTWGGSRPTSPAPSRTYSPPSRSYSPPSRSSSPPTRSYSAPSRSSPSYSAPSRSSSSYSAPSRSSSSGSRSSSSGGSRSSGGGSHGGGRHR